MGKEDEASQSFDRIKVRGTDDDAKMEAALSAWENTVRRDAAANGGVVPPKVSGFSQNETVRLLETAKARPQADDTETELNGLIAECRFLMHDVAFASACLTYDPEDRIRYLTAAQNLALTAAKVADTIGQLRHGVPAAPVQTRRHELVYMRAEDPSPLPPEPKGDKQ